LADGRKHGARVALFGRRIKDSEHPLEFIRMLRLIADGEIEPEEAVKSYHSELKKHGIQPKHRLEEDLQVTPAATS
jgi:citrate synthase